MALNDLTLSLTQGVRARAFEAEIEGLTTGLVEVLSDKGAPGFAVINGKVRHEALPYQPSAVVLREREPGKGYHDSRIIIAAADQGELQTQAEALIGDGRTLVRWWVDPVHEGGALRWYVRAEDDLGATYTEAVGGGTPTPTVPAQILDLTATPGDGEVSLAWTAPDDGGSPILDYVVQYKLSTEPTTWTTLADGTSATPGAVVTGLTNDSAYDFRAAAINAVGQGSWSDVVSATPAASAVLIAFDGTTFSNANGDPGQWTLDGTDITGETGATLTYVEATMAGRAVQQRVGGVLSNAFIIEMPLQSVLLDFNVPDGPMSAYPGHPATMLGGDSTDQAKYKIASGHGSVDRLNNALSPLAIATWPVGVNHKVKYTYSGTTRGNALAAVVDAANYLKIVTNTGLSNVLGVAKVIAGVETALANNGFNIPDCQVPGAAPELVVFNGKWQLRVNDLPYAKAVNWNNTPSAQTDIWYDLPTELLTGASVGVLGNTSFAMTFDDLAFASLDKPITLAVANVSRSPDDSDKTRIALNGTYGSGVTAIEFLVALADGTLVQNWTAGSALAGGVIDQYVDVPLTSGEAFFLVGRDPSDPSTAFKISTVAPILQSVTAYRRGVNEGYTNEWAASDRERNMFAKCAARIVDGGPYDYWFNCPDEQTGLTPDGQYHSYPLHPTTGVQTTKLGYEFPANSTVPGDYDVTYPPTMTASFASIVNMTVLQAPSGGTARVRVATGGSFALMLEGTIPPEGVGSQNVTLYKVGETDKTSYLSDNFIASMAAWAAGGQRLLYRNMSVDWINNQPRAFTVVNTGGQCTGPMSPKAWGEISRLNGVTDIFINIGHLNSDSYVSAFAAALNLEVNPASKIYVELSNEVIWNNLFNQHRWFYYEGAKAGYHVSGTTPDPIPGLLDFIDKGDSINRSTGALGVAVSNGTYIAYARTGAGWFVARANSDRPIGDIVPTTTNANWTIIADNNAMLRAAKRKYAERSATIFDIFDAEFGSDRIVPVIAYQHGSVAAFQPILEWNDLYQKLLGRGVVATAPYWGGGIAGWDLGSWTQVKPGWGSTEKALVSTDKEAFKDAFFAAAEQCIHDTLATVDTFKNDLAVWLVSKGCDKDAIQHMSYECNWHAVFQGGWPTEMGPVFGEIVRDPRMGDMMTLYATGLKTRSGGTHCWFDRIGKMPTSGSTLQSWAITESEADITSSNARFTALMAVV